MSWLLIVNGDAMRRWRRYAQALVGNYREEHSLRVEPERCELYDVYQTKVAACDKQIEVILKRLKNSATPPASKAASPKHRSRQSNAPTFDARAALHAILGVDLTQIDGLGPYFALKLVGECGTNLTAWPTAKHFTSWLGLAPHNKISGGKVLSSKTRRTSNRAASLLRLAAVSVGRTDTALGAFYRRLGARAGSRPRRSPQPPARSPFCSTIRFGTVCLMPIPARRTTKTATGNVSSAISNGARSRWDMFCTRRIGTPPKWLFLRKSSVTDGRGTR